MNSEIIFENKNIIAINKPAGLVVHPFDFSDEKTLIDFMMEKFPEIFSIVNEKKLQDGRVLNLGGLVHKLDRETSGVILFAKNQKTFDELKNLFQERKINKFYKSEVEGEIDEKEFIIDAPLGRNKKDYRQVVNPENPRGELREAITNVRVLEFKNGNTLVELNPVTGRTHQLRAHMKYINHPIVGDKVYGNKEIVSDLRLHAEKIEFELNGKEYKIVAKCERF